MANRIEDDRISVHTPEDNILNPRASSPPLSVVKNTGYVREMERLQNRKRYISQKIDNMSQTQTIKGLSIDIKPNLPLSPELQQRWETVCECTSTQLRNIVILQLKNDLKAVSSELNQTMTAGKVIPTPKKPSKPSPPALMEVRVGNQHRERSLPTGRYQHTQQKREVPSGIYPARKRRRRPRTIQSIPKLQTPQHRYRQPSRKQYWKH